MRVIIVAFRQASSPLSQGSVPPLSEFGGGEEEKVEKKARVDQRQIGRQKPARVVGPATFQYIYIFF